jgi:hypothetical protein
MVVAKGTNMQFLMLQVTKEIFTSGVIFITFAVI